MPSLRGLATGALVLTMLATVGCAKNDNGNNTLAGRSDEPTAPGAPQTTAASSKDPGGTGAIPLEAKDNDFEPKVIEAKAGTIVITMKNTGIAPHTFTNTDDFGGPVDVNANTGQTVDVELKDVKPGKYRFICKYHQPGMVGELNVT